MHPYIKKLKNYLEEKPINYDTKDPEFLIEDLYRFYQENTQAISEKLKVLNDRLHPYFAELRDDEIDAVFEIFYEMYREQEVLAFRGVCPLPRS